VSKGVVIYAFKKAAYGKFAYNLAVSIKHHNPNIIIAVLTDGNAFSHLTDEQRAIFDKEVLIGGEDLTHNGKFNAGKAKLSGYKYFPFDENMIVDADTICVADIGQLFNRCSKDVHAQVCGKFTNLSETWTCQWMPLPFVKEVFKLPTSYNIYEINSSFMYIKKGKTAEDFYKTALNNFISTPSHPKMRTWGGGFPDELAFNVAFAQQNIDPSFSWQTVFSNETQEPIFFSTKFTNDWGFVFNNFTFIGYFGDKHFTDKTLQAQYDRLMTAYLSKYGQPHRFKINQLMKEKHVLTK